MRAYCLTCVLTPEASELAQAVWYGLGMLGCEEEAAGDKIRLKCYFPDSASLHAAEFHLMDQNPGQPIAITVVPDEDWNAKWKKSMKPVEVVPGTWVSPAWLRPPLSPGQRWIKIEPKMAFGTGHHETTRLACKALSGLAGRTALGPRVLDIGTGSGILCFVSECLGFSLALGIDIDPVCSSNLSENRRKNSLKSRACFAIGSIDMIKAISLFDVVVMNMISSEGLPLVDRVFSHLSPGGFFIWSGLLLEEKNVIRKKAEEKNFILASDSRENEWWCAVFRKKEG
jgi:ribosomal protein L11 methyltransferase